MTAEQIRDIAIESSKNYYDYLVENEKGLQEVNVLEIKYPKGNDFTIKFRLAAKLFDIEAIFFHVLRTNKKFDTTQVQVIEYDSDKNILLVKVDDKYCNDFKNLNINDIKIISDLKFLVERVREWYVLNGAKLSLPKNKSVLHESIDKLEFIPGLIPSDNQLISLRNIFNSPFAYVWGAPGTGKTQFVLAYAILHYIKNDMKIAIMAPTNNAIEQVLRGVIKMTDKAGIPRNQIIRLGSPSRKFAEDFPEICEAKGMQKNLEAVQKQINIIEKVIQFRIIKNSLVNVEEKINNIGILDKELDREKNLKINIENEQIKFHEIENEIKASTRKIESLISKKTTLIKTTNTFAYKLKNVFNSNETKEQILIKEIDSEIENELRNNDVLNSNLKIQENKVSEERIKEYKYKDILEETINKIKNEFENLGEFSEIANKLNQFNHIEIKEELSSVFKNLKETEKKQGEIFIEYEMFNIEDLKVQLEKYQVKKNKISSISTEERLSNVNVVACTLDGYINRFTDVKLNVKHIFLDEAGYANSIKALTLFNHDVPISFLGDHMQLPPVCEINDLSIERDEKFFNMFLWAQSAICIETLFNIDANSARINYLKNAPLVFENIRRTTLTSTFRFGGNLAKVLSQHVYENNFTSENPDGETKIYVYNAPKMEGLRSRMSLSEVRTIEKITQKLKSIGQSDYVILTPYKKQVTLLNNHLPEERNDLKILTVHGSQGREWDTVILSVVDTSDKWFVDSTIQISKGLNLVNTAVSRAKKELIIVCDQNYWASQNGQLITDLINVET